MFWVFWVLKNHCFVGNLTVSGIIRCNCIQISYFEHVADFVLCFKGYLFLLTFYWRLLRAIFSTEWHFSCILISTCLLIWIYRMFAFKLRVIFLICSSSFSFSFYLFIQPNGKSAWQLFASFHLVGCTNLG